MRRCRRRTALAAVVGATLGVIAAVAAVAATGAAAADHVGVSIVPANSAACAGNATPPAAACFEPASVTTSPGGTVTWTNTTNRSLTLVRCAQASSQPECTNGPGTGSDDPFRSGAQVPSGGTYPFTFTGTGTYYYTCSGTASCSVGEVTVTAPTPTPQPATFSLAPPGTTPTAAPTPSATPSPTPSPTDTPSDTASPVALATPSTSASPSGAASTATGGGSGGGGSPLVPVALTIIVVLAVGGGVLSYRLFRTSR